MLVCPRVGAAVEALVPTAPAPTLALPGHPRPVAAVQVLGLHPPLAH